MSLSFSAIKKKFAKDPKKKALQEFKRIQKKTTSKHAWSEQHWMMAKFLLVLALVAAAYFQYQFYEQINQGAFQSTADVPPVGTSNIDVDALFSVLTTERERADVFAESLEYGPISFDPSRYDVVLLPVATPDQDTGNSTSTQAE